MTFARETYQYRALGYVDHHLAPIHKGCWRLKREEAVTDGEKMPADKVIVQKVRLGITKIMDTMVIRDV